MKTVGARAIAYTAVALVAIAALRYTRPIPERRISELITTQAPSVVPQRYDSLARGETLGELLGRAGLSATEVSDALSAATTLDARRIPAGIRMSWSTDAPDSAATSITLHLAIDRLLHLDRTASGWVSREELLPWTTDTLVANGVIASTLYDAIDSAASELTAGARSELAWDVADIYEYRVDMSRDLQPGDTFSVLFERRSGPGGVMRVGRVLVARYTNGGRSLEAVRYEASAAAHYYDQAGRSMEAAFLRAPLQFRRISSVFGTRKHPILGVWRAHKGTDYAAASGTPVRAIGDGVVVFVGRRGGYGNTLELRHGNGAVSRYGHLRGFAAGLHRGSRVSIGETVAYVGSTGLATGPHLHFEVLVGGVQRNPRTALNYEGGDPLPTAERARFEETRSRLVAMLDRSGRQPAVAAVN